MGDVAAYGFVLMNMLGQSSAFRMQFITRVQEAAIRHELPEDAVVFAEARLRQTATEERYKAQVPSHPALRDQISRLLKDDQAVRERAGFDLKKMEAADRRTAGPLKAIFNRYIRTTRSPQFTGGVWASHFAAVDLIGGRNGNDNAVVFTDFPDPVCVPERLSSARPRTALHVPMR